MVFYWKLKGMTDRQNWRIMKPMSKRWSIVRRWPQEQRTEQCDQVSGKHEIISHFCLWHFVGRHCISKVKTEFDSRASACARVCVRARMIWKLLNNTWHFGGETAFPAMRMMRTVHWHLGRYKPKENNLLTFVKLACWRMQGHFFLSGMKICTEIPVGPLHTRTCTWQPSLVS